MNIELSIFDKVKQLNLPFGKYVVVGGVLEAHGIRKANDIDIVTTPDLFQELINKGWKLCDCEACQKSTRKVLKGNEVDIYSDHKLGKHQPETEDLIRDADVIKGIPFLKLESLASFKRELGREKDLKDVQLIESFLDKQKK